MGIYHWKLGDIALARLCKKVYAKVKVVKNEDGIFYDDKVLAIAADSEDEDEATKELCYYVEIIRSGHRLWLPYTCLSLAERSRPFYGSDKPAERELRLEQPLVAKKRNPKEEHTLPLEVKIPKNPEPCMNITFESHHVPPEEGHYENAFESFIRRGKDHLYDEFYSMLQQNKESNYKLFDYLRNVDASMEEKYETVVKEFVSEKEIDNYLRQCWRYNLLHKLPCERDSDDDEGEVIDSGTEEDTDSDTRSRSPSPTRPESTPEVIIHTTWCLVCGVESEEKGPLQACVSCSATFHAACKKQWFITVTHRKNASNQKVEQPPTLVRKVLSSTRVVTAVEKENEKQEMCPSCLWGPKVGYNDVVWHKLGPCSWWPARVLSPGSTPPCLLSRSHTRSQWPLRYYGTLNHSWGETSRICLFLPQHAGVAATHPIIEQPILDACDDYISVYLT